MAEKLTIWWEDVKNSRRIYNANLRMYANTANNILKNANKMQMSNFQFLISKQFQMI